MNILLVDSDRDYVQAVRDRLQTSLHRDNVDICTTTGEARRRLQEGVCDIIVAAADRPERDWMEGIDSFTGDRTSDTTVIVHVEESSVDPGIETADIDVDIVLSREDDPESFAHTLEEVIENDVRDRSGSESPEMDIADVISSSDEAVLLIEDGIFTDCNRVAARMLGYETCDPIIGCSPEELSPPTQPDGQDSAKLVEEMTNLAARGGYHQFEWVHRRATGEDIVLTVSLTPIVTGGERMLYCVWREESPAFQNGMLMDEDTVDAPATDASVPRGDSIDVLVVDDEENRGRLFAAELEEATDIEAKSVTAVNKALQFLTRRAEFDCLVTVNGSGEGVGTQLIEHVRKIRPTMPVIVVIEDGDHDVGSRVIEAGASDYVLSGGDGNHSAAVGHKVRAAVEQLRLQRDVGSRIDQYRRLSEFLPDPTALFRRRRVDFCNESFLELTGRTRDQVRVESFTADVIHSGDRDRFDRLLDEWYAGEGGNGIHEVRVVTPDGTIRSCEVSGIHIDTKGGGAALVSFRDVTDRERRADELELERALYGSFPEKLIESRTRTAVERGVLDVLSRQDYDMVCIGEMDDSVMTPRAVRGDETYIEWLAEEFDAMDTGIEPCTWAARSGEAQFVPDFAELMPTPWRDKALESGYRSGGAVPVSHQEQSYGVLGIYSERPDQFDERERRVLQRFADAVAYVIHNVELENALAADAITEVTLSLDAKGYYLADLARDGAFLHADRVTIRGTITVGDNEVIQYLAISGAPDQSLRETLSSHPAVADVVCIAETDPKRLQVTVTESVPEGILAENGVIVSSTEIETTGVTIRIELPIHEDVRRVSRLLEPTFGTVSIRSSVQQRRSSQDVFQERFSRANLTEKQAIALQAAYYHGYFEQPRGNTATAIAESLGIAHSTFLQHLHRAQEKVFAQHLE